MAGASSPSENNLGRLDLSSLRYRIDEAIMDTDDGPAEVGKLAMLGESDRSIADILRDRAGAEERSEWDNAKDFLREALSSGPMPSREIQSGPMTVIEDGQTVHPMCEVPA